MRDVSLLTIAFSLFFAVITLTKPERSGSDGYMLALLALLNVLPIGYFVLAGPAPESGLRLSYVSQFAVLAFGPVFLFYNLAATDSNFHLRPSSSVLGIPLALYSALFLLPDTGLLQGEAYILLSFVISLVLLAFVLASLIIVFKRRAHTRSDRVTWLVGVNLGVLAVWSASVIQDGIYVARGSISFDAGYRDLTPYMLLALLVVLGVLNVRSGVVQAASRRRNRSRDEAHPHVFARIVGAMETEQLYLNPELNLVDMAIHLGERPETLSRAISAAGHAGFRELVNGYRIRRFKELVANGDAARFTIESVAFESGFNSKSSFYRVFVRETGTTPREYIAAQE